MSMLDPEYINAVLIVLAFFNFFFYIGLVMRRGNTTPIDRFKIWACINLIIMFFPIVLVLGTLALVVYSVFSILFIKKDGTEYD